MTVQPWTIERTATLSEARALMRDHAIRHLPVMNGRDLVGIVSQRDLYLVERFVGGEARVDEAMQPDVYAAELEVPLDEVAEVMAQRKYGSAVVRDRHGLVVGIFTTVDGMQTLSDVLRKMTA